MCWRILHHLKLSARKGILRIVIIMKHIQGFFQALTDLSCQSSKLNLKLSFETQSHKPKNKKVIETV